MTSNQFSISLRLGHWVVVGITAVLMVVGIWQSVMPYLAERHYRDGFNFDAGGRYKYAVDEFEVAVRYAPWETQYIMSLGKAYESLAEQTPDIPQKLVYLRRAESLYFETIDLDEKNPWQRNRLAAVYTAIADILPNERTTYLSKAEQEVRLAASYDNQNPLFQLNLAYFLHRLSRFEDAKKYYLIVLSMDPGISEARYNLADIYRREGRFDLVLAQYRDVYARNPAFPNINLALAGTYAQLGRSADAIVYMEAEIKARPDFVDGIKMLIGLQQQAGNWARVAELYYQLIMLNPGSKEYYPSFASAVRAGNKQSQTLASLSQLKAQNPGAVVLDELIALIR